MRQIFADTFYFVALLDRTDTWHERARLESLLLEKTTVVTSDAVMVEFVNFFSNHNFEIRRRVVQQVHFILGSPEFDVRPMTRSAMLSGLSLHASRSDKHYSLTDCISMQMMRELGIFEILTHDHHFGQEGFVPLLRGTA